MFTSKRINLRKVERNDTELYHAWRNDSEVMINTNPSLDLYSYDDTKDFVEGYFNKQQFIQKLYDR